MAAAVPALRYVREATDADADYTAALDHLEETVAPPIVACGYSFGAATAVRASRGRAAVRRLVLVAPPPALLDESALDDFSGPLLVVAGEADAIASAALLANLVGRARGTCEVIPEADHFFALGLREVGRIISAWLEQGD